MIRQYSVGDKLAGEHTVLKVFGGENKSGMGVVYLVQDRDAPWPYILKTYQFKSGTNNQQQFIAEAHAWINAGAHQNIVQAYWVRKLDGQTYVAAEYIAPDENGRNTLSHFLNDGLLKMEVVLQWAAQFCFGMDYAHSNGVLVHRDIKPDNLMIDQDGTLKITDFGLAKSIDKSEVKPQRSWWPFGTKVIANESASHTKTGSAMGTYPYMAPEQFVDAKNVDHRADIYSFGIILYQMVTGNKYPYQINSNAPNLGMEYFRAHSQEMPLMVDSPLMPIISHCLEKKVGNRYRDYDALLSDIKTLAKRLNIIIPSQVHVLKEDEALYAKAQSYVALGDSKKALELINEYTVRYPENACGWTEKGRIHWGEQEYTEAIKATKKSLAINPNNSHAWNNLGIMLDQAVSSGDDIKNAFNKALYFDPDNTGAIINLVHALQRLKEFDDIPELLVRALKLLPDKPNTLVKADEILKEYFRLGNLPLAKILLSGWVDARPKDITAWHNLGLVFMNEDDTESAIKCFEKIEELSPDDNFSVLQLARLYFKKKRGKESIQCCNKLIERGYEALTAVCLKAQVINLMGDYKHAVLFLQRYIKHNPDNDVLWVVLSEIHEYRDNYVAALEATDNAKKILDGRQSDRNSDDYSILVSKFKRLSAIVEHGSEPR